MQNINMVECAKSYMRDGEEARQFSYTYTEDGQDYYMVYFFDRKKGAYYVTGFLVLDQKGTSVDRDLAEKVNVSFNLYNHIFKRFKQDWGDVVQQDMRKYVAAKEHMERITAYYAKHQSEISGDQLAAIHSYHDVLKRVLAYQDRFLELDLEAIEIGQQKNEKQSINEQIMQRIEKLVQQFEQTVFEQIDIQNTSKKIRDQFVAYFGELKPPKEIKRSIKKALKMSKRMDKLVAKHYDRLMERKQDQTNENHYRKLKADWNERLRN